MRNSTTSTPQILHADQEHYALRLLVPVLLLIGFCLSFVAVQALLDALFPGFDARVFLACVAAVPIGLLLTYGVEQILKRTWRSGRKVALQADSLTLFRDEGEPISISKDKSLNLILWYFSLADYPRGGRERRVSASWFCLATSLRQDDTQVIFHTFAPPAEKEKWVTNYRFHEIDPTDVYDTSLLTRVTIPTRPDIPADIIAGQDGRYWLAERERWQHGVELTPPDFGRLLAHLEDYDIHY